MGWLGKLESLGVNPRVTGRFTITAGSGTDEALVRIDVTDSAGGTKTKPIPLLVWFSLDADGEGLAVAASGTVGAVSSSTGVVLGELTAKLAFVIMTNDEGYCQITITDSAEQAIYVCVQPLSGGDVFKSRVLTTADYNA